MPFLSHPKSSNLRCSRFNLNIGNSNKPNQTHIVSSSGSAFVWNHPAELSDNNPSSQEIIVHVQFLDKSSHKFSVDRKCYGYDLLSKVFKHLDLKESQYFGLLYCENESFPGSARWLDAKKILRKQLKGTSRLYFRVKFFAIDPEKLTDEYTRYLYVMQIRREIRNGNIYVDRNTAVRLAAILMQADFGNCDTSESSKPHSNMETFVPLQGPEFMNDVRKEHMHLEDLSPSSADLRYLEIVKHLDMYGVEIHHAVVSVREAANVELKVGVCSKGIIIFQGFQKISQFTWDIIAKISFRRRHFIIFLLNGVPYDDYPARLLLLSHKADTVISLILSSYQASKSLWKSCVDHHAFFRGDDENCNESSANGFPRITFDTRQRELSINNNHPRPKFASRRMTLQLCDPTKISKRKNHKEGIIANDGRSVNNTNLSVKECKINDSLSLCNCISESSRFPSPSPSHASVYSVLSPSAKNDTRESIFLEPYRSLRPQSRSLKDLFDSNIQFLMPRKFINSQRNKISPNSSILDQQFSDDEDNHLYVNESSAMSEASLHASMQSLKRDLQSSTFLSTFERLYRSKPGYTFYASKMQENFYKNRYKDVLPYDQTRVILKDGIDGEYINANFINMPINTADTINKYIATQGPLPTTSDDFWQMTWEQNIYLLVMLTTINENGRNKCHKYWPDVGEFEDYGRFQITNTKETRSPDNNITHRELRFSRKDCADRIIHHAQVESWPDHGIPSDYASFIEFIQWIQRKRLESPQSAILVHCSAGIGRTGVIILAETALCLIGQSSVPVYPIDIVKQMRNQRYSMIQTKQQFQFACEAILYAYRCRQQLIKI